MRVLHLFSNSKWTGPAEPALNLCVALRALGVETDFACAPGSESVINKIVETARDRGIEPILRFHLSKHRNPLWNALDRIALRAFLKANRYDLVHCHLDNDHRIAAGVAARDGIPVVRSSYEGLGFPAGRGRLRLLQCAAAIIEPSRRAMEHDAAMFGIPPDRMHLVPGAVDIVRFDPRRETPDARRWLHLPPDAFVIGIVARMQPHRHYEDLFVAFRRLLDNAPQAHLIVVGRGSKQDRVGWRPVRELGIEKHVHFPGFIDGENYVGMLRAFDVGVFLVPGSDGTCRAAREIMAMGKPMVVANRGMLAEIVTHGEDGLVFDGSADALRECLMRLIQDRARRIDMGRAARRTAETRYSLEVQSRNVLAVYEQVLRKTKE
mgnify:CR=1 FL=1